MFRGVIRHRRQSKLFEGPTFYLEATDTDSSDSYRSVKPKDPTIEAEDRQREGVLGKGQGTRFHQLRGLGAL